MLLLNVSKVTLIILCYIKNWTTSVKNFKKDCARIKVDLMKVKQINQFSTGDGATYNDNCQGKHRRDVDDEEEKMGTERATIPAKKVRLSDSINVLIP